MEHIYTAWIDVDNELPFESSDYLVAFRRDALRVGCSIAFFAVGTHGWVMDDNKVTHGATVTHWMALPSLPVNNG